MVNPTNKVKERYEGNVLKKISCHVCYKRCGYVLMKAENGTPVGICYRCALKHSTSCGRHCSNRLLKVKR